MPSGTYTHARVTPGIVIDSERHWVGGGTAAARGERLTPRHTGTTLASWRLATRGDAASAVPHQDGEQYSSEGGASLRFLVFGGGRACREIPCPREVVTDRIVLYPCDCYPSAG